MIQITPHMRILVAVEPTDFRKGIDGLVALPTRDVEVGQWRIRHDFHTERPHQGQRARRPGDIRS